MKKSTIITPLYICNKHKYRDLQFKALLRITNEVLGFIDLFGCS